MSAMRQSDNGGGFDGPIPNVSDDMGIVKLRGLPFGCNKEEIIQFFDGKNDDNNVFMKTSLYGVDRQFFGSCAVGKVRILHTLMSGNILLVFIFK